MARTTWIAQYGVRLLAMLALCAVLASALGLTVEASEDATLEGDVTVSREVQGVAVPGVPEFVRFCNTIGGGAGIATLTLGLAGMLALRRRLADAALVALTLLAHSANGLIKTLAASPRPTADLVRVTDPSHGFGFPSGHTMGTVVFCACVAYLAWRNLERRAARLAVALGAGLLTLAVGFSRIYAGAHWPSDVLGAYLWGGLFTVALITAWRKLVGHGAYQRPAGVA
jgi:undecaprenyl-diphosphatase